MQKLFITVLGIIFVNALFTLIPSINASIASGTLIVYQFYFNSLFLLSFLLPNRISFPKSDVIVQEFPVIKGRIIKSDDDTMFASKKESSDTPIYKMDDENVEQPL